MQLLKQYFIPFFPDPQPNSTATLPNFQSFKLEPAAKTPKKSDIYNIYR